MFEVFKVNLNGKLSHKENLNNLDELNTWIANVYGKFATVAIIKNGGTKHVFTDNGLTWEKVQ